MPDPRAIARTLTDAGSGRHQAAAGAAAVPQAAGRGDHVADAPLVALLVDLLRLERDRPPEFVDGGVSARAWARRVRELEEQLRKRAPGRVGAAGGLTVPVAERRAADQQMDAWVRATDRWMLWGSRLILAALLTQLLLTLALFEQFSLIEGHLSSMSERVALFDERVASRLSLFEEHLSEEIEAMRTTVERLVEDRPPRPAP